MINKIFVYINDKIKKNFLIKKIFNLIFLKERFEYFYQKIKRKFIRKIFFKFKNKSLTINPSKKRINKRYFFTYGDKNFIKSRERIVNEAKNTGLFDNCFFYSDLSLPNDDFIKRKNESKLFCEISSSQKFGFLWKPYILFKTLKELNEGDILVYSDAGSTIKTCKNSINQLEALIFEIEESDRGVIGIRNVFTEKYWTKGDVFKYFDVYHDPHFTQTKQFSAGRLHIAKKCSYSLKIYSKWWEIAEKRPDLFSDAPSSIPNLTGFIQNRHDQSVWSLLCKKYGVIEKEDSDLFPIEPSRIRK